MSKMSAEGSIPSGRAASLTEENQVVSTPATGQTSGAWSGVGPKPPRFGDLVEINDSGAWVKASVLSLNYREEVFVGLDVGLCDEEGWVRVGADEWRWPVGVIHVEKAVRVPVPFRDRVRVRSLVEWSAPRVVLEYNRAKGMVRVPDEHGSLLHPLWFRREEWCWPDEVMGRALAGDPGVTHGKGGVPPLAALPDPDAVPEPRRCVGAPGCSCDAVLGPVAECPSDRCAHCENLAREIERQTADTEEGFVDCDACNPDRQPRTGKLCGRCQARRKAFLDDAGELLTAAGHANARRLSDLVALHYMTPDEAQGVRSALGTVLTVLAAELKVMSARQEVTAVALLREAVSSLIGLRAGDARIVERAVRS